MAERLQTKSVYILQALHKTNNHWEEIFWQLLAKNFGSKVNAALFEEIAKSLSIHLLAKHKNQLNCLEALLLGQANLLTDDFTEQYPAMLKREYIFLQNKYSLCTISIRPAFLRMRPANFPTVRLAQLAALIHQSSHLFF